MRSHDSTLYDFTLVWTYLPVLIIILRSSVLLAILYWWVFTVNLPQHGVLMLCVSLVYVDSLLMQSNHFDRSCGHLCACALAVLTQHGGVPERSSSPTQEVVLIACDLLWSACAGAEVLARTTGLSVPLSHLNKVVLCCIFASVRVVFSYTSIGLLQSMFRSALYYVLCSLIILCGPLVRQQERSAPLIGFQSSSVVYMCVHVLFVHLYAVIASVLVIVGIHARLIYRTFNPRGDDSARMESGNKFAGNKPAIGKHTESLHAESLHANSTQSTHSISGGQGTKEHSDLIIKLQAAKKASGIT